MQADDHSAAIKAKLDTIFKSINDYVLMALYNGSGSRDPAYSQHSAIIAQMIEDYNKIENATVDLMIQSVKSGGVSINDLFQRIDSAARNFTDAALVTRRVGFKDEYVNPTMFGGPSVISRIKYTKDVLDYFIRELNKI